MYKGMRISYSDAAQMELLYAIRIFVQKVN